MSKQIKYRKGYKYQLHEDYHIGTGITGFDIKIDFIWLSKNGVLSLWKGYAWDGPSGPAIDTPTFMRGSLVHDALFQLIGLGLLPQTFKDEAHEILYDICVEDGMWIIRAKWVYWAVKWFWNGKKVEPRQVITAP